MSNEKTEQSLKRTRSEKLSAVGSTLTGVLFFIGWSRWSRILGFAVLGIIAGLISVMTLAEFEHFKQESQTTLTLMIMPCYALGGAIIFGYLGRFRGNTRIQQFLICEPGLQILIVEYLKDSSVSLGERLKEISETGEDRGEAIEALNREILFQCPNLLESIKGQWPEILETSDSISDYQSRSEYAEKLAAFVSHLNRNNLIKSFVTAIFAALLAIALPIMRLTMH